MSLPKTNALILLIDDNKMGLAARRHVLDELGYRTQTAASAHAAVELYSKNLFDLVVTDYKMPDMSGIDLIQKLRHIRQGVPIVLISGFVDVLGLDEQTTGADVVMAKNSNEVNHLVRVVGRLLNRKPVRKPPGTIGGDSSKARKRT
jgi:CheY-like chemotaxis protein